MYLTKECDYAIRVVRALADMEMKPVRVICDLEYIPRPFAYKILKKLEHAGIVSAYRGAGGGYRLAGPPNRLALLDIISAIDENLFINECLNPDNACPRNPDKNPCEVHRELGRIQKILEDALSEKTVNNLL